MLESIFGLTSDASVSIISAVLTLGFSCLLGLMISGTYLLTRKNGHYSQNFLITLVLMPMIVAIIILLVGSNVARAFSLAGAFSLVRFRSAPGDPKDITYVFFAMAAGLAVGTGFYLYGVLFAAALCLVIWTLDKTGFGRPRSTRKMLKITIPEDLDYQGVFDGVFENHNVHPVLEKVRSTDLGSLFELVYSLNAPETLNEKQFLDDVRCRNGNLNIILTMQPESNF